MVIAAKEIGADCTTFAQGEAVRAAIETVMAAGRAVRLSFRGVSGVNSIPTSFANGAFVGLLKRYSLSEVKNSLRIEHSNGQINHMIKRRLADAAALRAQTAATELGAESV